MTFEYTGAEMPEMLNKKQRDAYEALAGALKAKNARVGLTELKEVYWHVIDDFVTVIIEYGMPNDEGTMASIFARDRRHVHIGPHGGFRLLNCKYRTKCKQTGLHNCVFNLTDY